MDKVIKNRKGCIDYVEENFLYQNTSGLLIPGVEGFVRWSEENHKSKSLEDKLDLYAEAINQYGGVGLINAIDKISKTFTKRCLDQLFYIDSFNIKGISKSKFALLLGVSKVHSDKKSSFQLMSLTKDRVLEFVKSRNISAVAFVPPSVKRSVQIMSILEKGFEIQKPHIKIDKISRNIAQKNLPTKEKRIENAKNTFEVRGEGRKYEKVLLIDDMTGSGATLNEIACKIKDKGISENVIGLTLVGEISSKFPIERAI